MCSIQDAFPDLNFSNNTPAIEQKVSKAKTDLLNMQEERGKMMSFQCSDVTTPYFLQNQPNMPHIAKTTLAGDFSVPGSTNTAENMSDTNNQSAFTPEVITDPGLLAQRQSTQQEQQQSEMMVQQLASMVQQLDAKVSGLERKCNNRNSHDMLLFIVIVIFVILVVDTLMKN
jgi:hypothetical protein